MYGVLILVFFLLLIIPSATPLNFSFPSFSTQDTNTILTEGNASLEPESLRLTKSAYAQVGRATYKKPFLLWNETTGKLADFNTSFSFSINSENNPKYGDGLAFFIAPDWSSLNVRLGVASSLGLPCNSSSTPTCEYPFVAVEFDIYRNNVTAIEDPSFSTIDDHVGIDVCSLKSRVTAPWNGSILTGERNTVTVRYDSSTNNLSVVCTNFLSVLSISDKVDLKEYLPDRVIVGFSASTGGSFAMHNIISWNFTSSLDESLEDSIPPISAPKPRNKNKIKLKVAIGMGVGGGIILVVGLALVLFIFWVKSETCGSEERPICSANADVRNTVDPNRPAPSVETSICNTNADEDRVNREMWGSEEDPMIRDSNDFQSEKIFLRKFSYKELASATSNFAVEKKLGEGGFGEVYRGLIDDVKLDVAVKKISPGSRQGHKEYEAEVKIISKLQHPHLVQLIGCCDENGEFMLVYNFISNGSLDTHLFTENLLSWEVRYRIVKELASVIYYLQEESGDPYVVHRDIKSSNIMLDSDFTAKLGDFGLARLLDRGQSLKTTRVAGTTGYMAPEYVTPKAATKKSDVYSFGIVALEIACGRRPIFDKPERGKFSLVEWVWEFYGESKVIEAADPRLRGEFDEKEMMHLMVVGLWCAHPDPKDRASIEKAIQVLNFNAEPLPDLPHKMPVPVFPRT